VVAPPARECAGVSLDRVERLTRVISPLAFTRASRGTAASSTAPPPTASFPATIQALWQHWGKPRLDWYEGSHTSFGWESTVRGLLLDALRTSQLV
jgi:hypothetical protein